ncbi:MAG: hypothetical protein EXR49_04955 [Dehalococcoidia bacterium]|nr:hypothetical protein [Dehalococcoidia bacterium]
MAKSAGKPGSIDARFDTPDHFEEGLIHLVDMLELADPRRNGADKNQEKLRNAGLALPPGGTVADWRVFCKDVSSQLRSARPKMKVPFTQASIDAAIARIEQMIE